MPRIFAILLFAIDPAISTILTHQLSMAHQSNTHKIQLILIQFQLIIIIYSIFSLQKGGQPRG